MGSVIYNHMYEIPNLEDKIKALFTYLNYNGSDTEGDSWYYGHNPNIVAHINDFSIAECEKLTAVIWNWKDSILYNLADPLLEISNAKLDGYYLYGRIFLKIIDVEMSEYLVENIHVLRSIAIGSQPFQFYLDLEKKVTLLNGKEKGRYINSVEQIRLKIDEETNYWNKHKLS